MCATGPEIPNWNWCACEAPFSVQTPSRPANGEYTTDGDSVQIIQPEGGEVTKEEERLARRRKELWEFLCRYHEDHGYAPSRPECAVALKTGQGSIDQYLKQLERDQWVEIDPGVKRGIRIRRTGIPVADAITGKGSDETELERPRMNNIKEMFGQKPDLLVRVGNDAMSGAKVEKGDLMALAQNRAPEDGDIVAAQMGSTIEVRRFAQTHAGDMLGTEPEAWTGHEAVWTRADAEDVKVLGVGIGWTKMTKGREQSARRTARARKRKRGRSGEY